MTTPHPGPPRPGPLPGVPPLPGPRSSGGATSGGASSEIATSASTTAEPSQDLVARVRALRGRPLAEHADTYDEIHAELQRSLAGIDTR